jgi:hypothetical protein
MVRYNYASPSQAITRLTSRNMHLLALRVSEFLNLKPDPVLKHWACAKISRSRPSVTAEGGPEMNGDDEICRVIVEKFEGLGGIDVSYAEIAKKAWEAGRTGLATKVCLHQLCLWSNSSYRTCQLLDHESRASDQVPLLLSMKEDKLALIKAVDSGDTDLGS